MPRKGMPVNQQNTDCKKPFLRTLGSRLGKILAGGPMRYLPWRCEPRAKVYKSSREVAVRALECCIAEAEREVLVAMYDFTHPRLADALIASSATGVTVRVMLDWHKAKNAHSQALRLLTAGVAVRLDRPNRFFHHKFMVVDDVLVVTGSMNWTKAARLNADHVVILRSRSLAGEMGVLHRQCWRGGREYADAR